MVNELELENKNLMSDLVRFKSGQSASDSDTLLEDSLRALDLMRTKVSVIFIVCLHPSPLPPPLLGSRRERTE
jgi:hypothetical protein